MAGDDAYQVILTQTSRVGTTTAVEHAGDDATVMGAQSGEERCVQEYCLVRGTIDYHYSTRSVHAYFGAERIVALARDAGREIERWSEYLDIPALVDPVHHVGNREWPSGFVIAAQQQGADADALHVAILRALWQDDRDIGDPADDGRAGFEAAVQTGWPKARLVKGRRQSCLV